MNELKLIPQVSEWRPDGECTLKVELPVSYMGFCPEEDVFPLVRDTKGKALLLVMEGEEIPDEGYELEIDTDEIVIHYGDDLGRFYALVTLFEMIRIYKGEIPCGHITDAPKYEYRGFMFDVSRHFFTVEEIKKILDEMAGLKLNEFHWHLSDDQGFRIESKKFPKLNEIGSRRIEPDGSETFGYYTQEEIKEVVDYADARCIEVVPEIDLPGHTSAIIAAYPEFSCDGKEGKVQNGAGIFSKILCPGKDAVMQFLYELLDEIVPLFPGRFFHIGGDEAPKSEWQKCPDCQARMKAEGLDNEEQLQGWFTDQLVKYLEKKDKMAIGWNEFLNDGPKDNAVGQYWVEFGPETKMKPAIDAGQQFIFSQNGACYCDYPYGLVTLIGTYSYGPEIKGIVVPEDQVLGLESPVWTERIPDTDRLEHMIFPRLQALAENAWSVNKDFESFKVRMKEREAFLAEKGLAFTPVEEADIRGPEGIPLVFRDIADTFARMTGASNDQVKPDGGINMEMPEEMKQNMAMIAKSMMHEFLHYAHSEEEMELIFNTMMQKMMG